MEAVALQTLHQTINRMQTNWHTLQSIYREQGQGIWVEVVRKTLHHIINQM